MTWVLMASRMISAEMRELQFQIIGPGGNGKPQPGGAVWWGVVLPLVSEIPLKWECPWSGAYSAASGHDRFRPRYGMGFAANFATTHGVQYAGGRHCNQKGFEVACLDSVPLTPHCTHRQYTQCVCMCACVFACVCVCACLRARALKTVPNSALELSSHR